MNFASVRALPVPLAVAGMDGGGHAFHRRGKRAGGNRRGGIGPGHPLESSAFEPGGGVNVDLCLSAAYRLSGRWRLIGGVSA